MFHSIQINIKRIQLYVYIQISADAKEKSKATVEVARRKLKASGAHEAAVLEAKAKAAEEAESKSKDFTDVLTLKKDQLLESRKRERSLRRETVARMKENRKNKQLLEEAEIKFQRDTRKACQASAKLAHRSSSLECTAEDEQIDKSRAHKAESMDRLHGFFEQSNMQREICACCFEKVKKKNIHIVPGDEEARNPWLKRLTNRLNWRHVKDTVSHRTKLYYDASEKAPDLAGLPLAPSGVNCENGSWQV